MKLVIPSYQRANNIPALEFIPENIKRKYVEIAVRDSEIEQYKELNPDLTIVGIGDDVSNIAETRQRINELYIGQRIIVMDDDVSFHNTYVGLNDIIRSEKTPLTEVELEDLIKLIGKYMDDGYYFGGIRNLLQPRNSTWLPLVFNKSTAWIVWFDLAKFDTKKYSYKTEHSGIEDVSMTLQIFESGYNIPIITEYSMRNHMKYHDDGGCSDQRSGQIVDERTKLVHERFPEFTTLRKSTMYKHIGATLGLIVRLNAKKRDRLKGERQSI